MALSRPIVVGCSAPRISAAAAQQWEIWHPLEKLSAKCSVCVVFFLPLKTIFGSGKFSGMIMDTNAIPANIFRGIYHFLNV